MYKHTQRRVIIIRKQHLLLKKSNDQISLEIIFYHLINFLFKCGPKVFTNVCYFDLLVLMLPVKMMLLKF